MIIDYINQYAETEAVVDEETILQYWRNAKSEYLFNMFGNELILKRKISYKMPIAEIEEILCRNCNHLNTFYDYIYDILRDNNQQLFFRIPNGYNYSYVNYLTSIETLINNVWEYPDIKFPLPGGKSFKACRGTKITRILGKMADAWKLDYWEEIREAHAKALTSKYTTGTLCLSIHPMDYITMSDNAEDWDSCMSWMSEGSYRAGTVEMMNSKSVVVAYLESPTKTLPNGWNSKIWRELFIITPEIITEIKPYPHVNTYLSEYCATWLKELAETANLSKYDEKPHILPTINNESNSWFGENKIKFRFMTNTMYNDTRRNNQITYVKEGLKPGIYRINYSGVRSCMSCGAIDGEFGDDNMLTCEKCRGIVYQTCEHCGYISCDELYELDGLSLCYDCYCEYTTAVINDDENHHSDNCTPITVHMPDGSDQVEYVYNYNEWEYSKYFNENQEIAYENLTDELKSHIFLSLDIKFWDSYKKSTSVLRSLTDFFHQHF